MPNDIVIKIYDHVSEETIYCESLEQFIQWLNMVDDIFSYSIKENENV